MEHCITQYYHTALYKLQQIDGKYMTKNEKNPYTNKVESK